MSNTKSAESSLSKIVPQIESMTFSTALEGSIKARQQKSKKSVSFSHLDDLTHHVEHAADLTDEERSRTWFSRKEFSEIKASYREILKRMSHREHIPDDSDQCSTRGLEGRSRHGSKNRLSIIMSSILAVLNEQDIQRQQGRVDAETIAILYRHQSYHSLQAAVMMARRDEAAIAEYVGRRPQQPSHERMMQAQSLASQPRNDLAGLSRRHMNLGLQHGTNKLTSGANRLQAAPERRPVAATMQSLAVAA